MILRQTLLALISGCLFVSLAGCAGETEVNGPPTDTQPVTASPPTPPPSAPKLGGSATPSPASDGEVDEPEVEAVKAEAGVGKKGTRYGGGIISEPVSAYFRTRGRIAFLQMEKGMKEFKALNDRAPESHEEFMDKIIGDYGVELPELPDGESYQYDPEQEQLMVLKPAP